MPEGVWSVSLEDSSVSFMTSSGNSSEDRELNLIVPVLNASWSSDLFLLVEHCCSDDGNSIRGGTMVSCHFRVQLADCSIEGNISVLLVHIMVSSSGFISEDDSESFDKVRSFLKDLICGQNLTLSTLSLKLTSKVVPEF